MSERKTTGPKSAQQSGKDTGGGGERKREKDGPLMRMLSTATPHFSAGPEMTSAISTAMCSLSVTRFCRVLELRARVHGSRTGEAEHDNQSCQCRFGGKRRRGKKGNVPDDVPERGLSSLDESRSDVVDGKDGSVRGNDVPANDRVLK